MSRLDQLVDAARDGVRRRSAEKPGEELRSRLAGRGGHRPFKEALVTPGLSVIAEFKRGSPSAGAINPDADVAAVVEAYERGGAAAISVLTEARYFQGSPAHLEAIRAAVDVPLLRKDFIVDPYQVAEARAWGADAILLIAAALDDAALRELHAAAGELGLEVLVEAHTAAEADRAVAAGAALIGINNRDLRTFVTTLETAERLRGRIPPGVVAVAESGIETPADVARLRAAGYDAFLVGESLMRQPDPGAALQALLGEPGR
jgi:indole-3-glycerol phosphate synthase